MTELLLFAALGNLIASRQAFSEQRSVTVGATNKSAKERFTHLQLRAMNDHVQRPASLSFLGLRNQRRLDVPLLGGVLSYISGQLYKCIEMVISHVFTTWYDSKL